MVEAAREYVVDVPTVAGLWPFATRSPQPLTGIPLGTDPHSGHLAGYDPYTAFLSGEQRAAQLAILASNGTGKSVLAKKLATGLAGQGVPVIVPFDAKNEYTNVVHAIGGTTLSVDRAGGLNALDPGEVIQHAHAIDAPPSIIAELEARRNQLLATVAAIGRGAPLAGWEQAALAAAADLLPPGAVLGDLAGIFTTKVGDLALSLAVAQERAEQLLEPLALDVAALANGPIGQALGTHDPSQRWVIDQALVIDTSGILASEPELTAAVSVTCWTAALSAIHLQNQSVDSGPGVFAVIFDEIWRATREFPALANQIGGLLRMDRNDGVVSILATHSWTDTEQPGGSNILARCAAFAIGGMQNEEIDAIATAGIGLNAAELAEIRRNAAGGTTRDGSARGGTGRFLIKTADQPGQLIQTVLTPTERTLYNTNQKWERPHLSPGRQRTPVPVETLDHLEIEQATDAEAPISAGSSAEDDRPQRTTDRGQTRPAPTDPDVHRPRTRPPPPRRQPHRRNKRSERTRRQAPADLAATEAASIDSIQDGGLWWSISTSIGGQLLNAVALNSVDVDPVIGVAVTGAITAAGLTGIYPHARRAFATPTNSNSGAATDKEDLLR